MFFEQPKPITVKILGIFLLVLAPISIYDGIAPLSQVVSMFFIGVLLLSYSVSYEINTKFDNKRHIRFFGMTVFKSKLLIFFPDYIAVVSARFKQHSDLGPVAAIGKGRADESLVIRLFKGNKHFTVFKAKSFELVSSKAERLGELLNVTVRLPK